MKTNRRVGYFSFNPMSKTWLSSRDINPKSHEPVIQQDSHSHILVQLQEICETPRMEKTKSKGIVILS